jgi:hypothetical protein
MSKTLTEAQVTTAKARSKLELGVHWRRIDAEAHLGRRWRALFIPAITVWLVEPIEYLRQRYCTFWLMRVEKRASYGISTPEISSQILNSLAWRAISRLCGFGSRGVR